MTDILVVVDMQKDFIYGALGTPEARAIVPKVYNKIWKYIEAGKEVAFTLDTHNTMYDNTNEGKHLPVCHCVEGTEGWQLVKELDIVYKKLCHDNLRVPTFKKNTFGSVELGEWIKWISHHENLKSIEVIGVCTDICVLSNVLLMKAFAPELEYYVDADCCAGTTPIAHDAALKVMKSCHINII